ncbi:MAG: hypothetical protein V1871_07045 [Planctomycetota bacterium]
MLNNFQFAFLKDEWLSSLQTLQGKWGGKLTGLSSNALDGFPQYVSLVSQIGQRKVYIDRENKAAFEPCIKIHFWGNWGLELFLGKEDLHDKFLKSLGLEYELSLEGNEINILDFNKKFLIKGTPPEPIKAFFSDSHTRDLIDKMEDFEALHIKDGMLKIIYDLNSAEQIKADRLTDLVNAIIKFIEAIENNELIPKIPQVKKEKIEPKSMLKPLVFDFNNKKTVSIVLVVELFLLAVFGSSITNGFSQYSISHDIGDFHGAMLILLIFGAPISILTILTVRKLIVLFTISSCGVTLDSNHIKSGDSVNFALGLTSFRTIKIREISLTVGNTSRDEKTDGIGHQAVKNSETYSKNYPLAQDFIMERKKPYIFRGQISIPTNTTPSGLTKDGIKGSVINAISIHEYYAETSIWIYQVNVKIANCPDYYFEQEFKVYPPDSAP